MKSREINGLVGNFQEKRSFSAKQLYDYWLFKEGPIKRATMDWRIYDLKQRKILQEVKKGWYTLDIKPIYSPDPDKRHLTINKVICENYRNVRYSIWNTDWLNEFSVHQFNKGHLIVEIEKDVQESLRNTLLEKEFIDLGWSIRNPGFHFLNSKSPVFILPLLSRAPVQNVMVGKKECSLPTLEKILVDIYDDHYLFQYVQGAELERIFAHAITKYAINFTTLFGYAKRRNKENRIKDHLKNNFSPLLSIVTQ